MLLVSTKNGSCLVVREGEVGRVEMAATHAGLGWAFDSVELVAEDVKPIRFGGVERVPDGVLDFVDPERVQALGYLAYQLVDELSETARGRARDCVSTFYHQISDTLRRILLVHQVLTTADQRVFIVDDELLHLISSCAHSLKSLKVIDLREPRERLLYSLRQVLVRPPAAVAAFIVRRVLRAAALDLRSIKDRLALFLPSSIHQRKVIPPIKLSADASHRSADSDILVLTLDDGGKRSNLDPARAILRELISRGIETVVMTEAPFVASEIRREGLAAVVLASDYICSGALPRESLVLETRLCVERELDLRNLLNAMLRRRHRFFFHRLSLLERLVAEVAHLRTVRVVLSINEALPPSVVAGRWAKRSGKPWIGHFPILVGRRPDGYYFPADFHLVYGEQLHDHMVAAGVRPETIEVVGSYIYDKHRGRDRAADRRASQKAFPKIGDNKLVTVLTEVLPSPEKELVPILMAVTSLPDVHVVLKVHPDDAIEQFNILASNAGVRDQIDIVKLCDLDELLGASSLLICVMSNVAIQAAVAGTPTLVCDFSGRTTVINLVQEGLCVGCTEPAKVAEDVRRLLSDPISRRRALDLMMAGIRRFNGPNDGHSAKRIVDFAIARAREQGAWDVDNCALAAGSARAGSRLKPRQLSS